MSAMSQTILVVDDDPHIRQLLVFALGKAGFQTREAEDGEAALDLIGTVNPDLVVLDINLPRMNGLDVCRRVRAEAELPILILSSRDDEIDRVLGIELGADDYVVKPFSPREVVARVTAILRRSATRPTVQAGDGAIRRGRLALDPEAWRATWGGVEAALTVTEFSILRMLAAAPSKVFSRDAIIDRLHGPGFAVTDRTIDSHIRNLRSKFAKLGGHDVVETRAGVGYRLGACLAAKNVLKRHWPALRLREILLAVLLFAAAMPAIEAVWLRGYENTLVRQTETELVAQGMALAAAVGALWPGAKPEPVETARKDPGYYRPENSTIDLSTTPTLSERPVPVRTTRTPDPDAVTAAGRANAILDETSRGTLASIVMLDRQGLVVRGVGLGGDLSLLPEVRAALSGHASTVLRRNMAYHPRYSLEWLSRASALRLHQARPIRVNGQVVGVLLLSRSPRALFRGLYEDLGKMAFGAAVIVGLLIGLAGLVSRGVTRPIEALSVATRAVAAGRGAVPDTPPTAAVEIRALYEDFRRMAEVIAKRSRYLRDFAASVSHEFKTPLAGITGAVELLQDHYGSMSPDERNRFLANIGSDSARLSQLVARLLDLARADMARPEADAVADVQTPARRVADALSNPSFKVAVRFTEDSPQVAIPEAILETVLTTLVDNSRQAKARNVTLTARNDGTMVTLEVADDGPGVPAPDRERLFEPFFTTRRVEGGTGLGLPIARSLIEAHGGGIALIASDIGAVFRITLPVKGVD
jgi:DNA-binding response OmpR family regulator/signal transduction histidine kinase